MAIDESNYKAWLGSATRLTAKGQNDRISRLRRADRLCPISDGLNLETYLPALLNSAGWSEIPKVSQQSISAAVKHYFEWKG
jgi:hypothetical protein